MNPHRFGAAVPRTCLSAANHSFALHALKNLPVCPAIPGGRVWPVLVQAGSFDESPPPRNR
jgi:hypothetical protein